MTRPEARGTDADYLREHQYKDPEQCSALEGVVAARFAQEGGQMTITAEAGCFVAKEPIAGS